MKIIFCICLLSVTVCRSYGQSEQLSAIIQGKVTFPAAVKKNGQLVYEGDAIADVTNGQSNTGLKTRFSGRVEWNSRTGLFSISDLEADDSGAYQVQVGGGNKTYVLTLYIPVSKPNVSVTSNKYPCKLMCTVERGTGVTLSWYREGEEESYIHTHPLSAPDLKLPQAVDKSGIYTCEAKNSVSTNTSDAITVGPHCTASSASSTGMIVGIVIGFLFFAIIGFVAGFCYSKKCPNATSAGQPNGKGPEVQPDASNTEEAPLNAANGKGTN